MIFFIKFAFLDDTKQLKTKLSKFLIFCNFHKQDILTGYTDLVCKICAAQHRVSIHILLFPCLPSKENIHKVNESTFTPR